MKLQFDTRSMMAILQSCCCWRSVRKGSYASAAYTATYFTVTLVVMGKFLHQERFYWMGNVTVPQSASMLEETISPTTMVFNLIVLACSTVGIITSAILTYGIYCDNKILLIPWILTVIITSMVDLVHSFFLFTTDKMTFEPTTAILFTMDFFLLSMNVYCILCVVSQYQEYKAGRGTADFEFSNRRIPCVKYTPQPTGTSFLSTRRAVTYHETKASPTGSPPRPLQVGRKHVQWGGEAPPPPPPPAVIHMESPKDSVSSDLNCKSGGSPSEEGGSSVEWANGKPGVDTLPLINPPPYEEVVIRPL